jgi:hypothetical protein
VPSCPGWTVDYLARRVGEVYLHKTLAMREGAGEPSGLTVEGAPAAVQEQA